MQTIPDKKQPPKEGTQTKEEAAKPQAAKPFYTAVEAIKALEELVAQQVEEGIVAVEDIQAILDRVVIAGQLTLRGIKAGLLEALQRAEAAGGQKISGAHLFAYMNRGGNVIPLPTIDTALLELEREGVVHSDRSGALTVYGVGKAPAATEDAAKSQ